MSAASHPLIHRTDVGYYIYWHHAQRRHQNRTLGIRGCDRTAVVLLAAIFQPLSSRGSTTLVARLLPVYARWQPMDIFSCFLFQQPHDQTQLTIIKVSLSILCQSASSERSSITHNRLCNTFPCHFHFLFLPRTKTKLNRLHRNRQVVMQYFRLLCDAPLLLLVCLHSIARFRDQTLTFFSVFPPRFVQMIIHAYD